MAAVASSDKTADLLHSLSLDPEAKAEASAAGEDKDVNDGSRPSVLPHGGSITADTGSNLEKLGYKNPYFNPKGTHPTGLLYSPGYRYHRFGYDGSFSSGKTSRVYHYPYLNTHQTRSTGMARSLGYMDGHAMYGLEAGYGYAPYGYETWKQPNHWYVCNNVYGTSGHGFGGYRKENIDGLNELSRGPRAKGFTQNVAATEKPKEGFGVTDTRDYDKEDLPETFLHAKFYVIKSYSEDDVHRSIKYSVWSSTGNGNKKLDAAYSQAQEKSESCPVFLLFSVNTSGQFVGVAEMVGPVDFNKTAEYWQQDKWIGCFPVKWRIIKDVPNSSLRHITLENNENKPVTNSRDTQEVNLDQGVEVIKIFKDHSSKTSILDDFAFYDAREKIIQDRKAKHQQFKKQVLSSSDNNCSKDASSTGQRPKTNGTTDSRKAEEEADGECKRAREKHDVASTCLV